jgi:hypothetical protein
MVAGLDQLGDQLSVKKLYAILAVLLAACGNTDASPVVQQRQDSVRTVVDSIFTLEEDVRRFKESRGSASAAQLEGGAASRDELVRKFVTALEQRDTATLSEIVINAAEFIDLYYPASMFARPPYRQSPELRWFLMQENSNKGLSRLLQRYGGKPTGYAAYSCATRTIEGHNTIHDRCTLSWSLQPRSLRAFSTIVERGGRFKIMSYANEL